MIAASVPQSCVEAFERLALDVTGVRLPTLARARVAETLGRFASERGCDVESLLDALRTNGASLVSGIVGELTTKETYLFRDPAQFECLADDILPRRIEEARGARRKVRIWSAGCSTGEEAYSAAMMLAEAGVADAVVLATDLSEAAIERARSGSAAGMRLAPDAGRFGPLVAHWIRESPTGPAFAEEVRSLLRFTTHNVLKDQTPVAQDIVLCRNVMIYFPPEGQRALVAALWDALLPGGALLLGEAELLHIMDHRFERVLCDGAVIYRKPPLGGGADDE